MSIDHVEIDDLLSMHRLMVASRSVCHAHDVYMAHDHDDGDDGIHVHGLHVVVVVYGGLVATSVLV